MRNIISFLRKENNLTQSAAGNSTTGRKGAELPVSTSLKSINSKLKLLDFE
jgi:hypothetical protein